MEMSQKSFRQMVKMVAGVRQEVSGGDNGRYYLERRAWTDCPAAGRPNSPHCSGTIFSASDAHLYPQSTVPPRVFF